MFKRVEELDEEEKEITEFAEANYLSNKDLDLLN
jgi:hypothetical protein